MSDKKTEMDDMPSDAELDALQAEIKAAQDEAKDKAEVADLPVPEQLKAKIEKLEAENAMMKDQALRAMAEAENVKKRAEREVKAASKYGIEKFAIDIVSVHDNLGRALLGLGDKDLGENAKALVDGIGLTEKELMAVLARHGVTAVPGKGSKFDPNVHQAVAQIPSAEDKGNVAEVMQTGFKLGDRTLRAAMVAVSTGPAKT